MVSSHKFNIELGRHSRPIPKRSMTKYTFWQNMSSTTKPDITCLKKFHVISTSAKNYPPKTYTHVGWHQRMKKSQQLLLSLPVSGFTRSDYFTYGWHLLYTIQSLITKKRLFYIFFFISRLRENKVKMSLGGYCFNITTLLISALR